MDESNELKKDHMKRWRKKGFWPAATVIVGIVVSLYYRQGGHVIEVETVPVKRGELIVTVTPTETGTVDSDATAQVKAEVAGRIVELAAAEGARVEAGDLLARLDASELEARVALARSSLDAARMRLESARISLPLEQARTRAALAEAQARYDDAKQRYDKKHKLYESKLIPQGEMETSRTDLAAAAAGLQAAQANQEQVALQQRQIEIAAADVKQQQAALRVAEVHLDHTCIRAPVAGTVVEWPIKLGELMQPGGVVARITRLDALYVKAQIDEVDLSRLRAGQRSKVQFDTQPGVAYDATLFEISSAVSVEKLKSRNVTVKLRLAQPPPFLRPGMSADVEIIVDTLKDVPVVPAQTVMAKDKDKERFVYVLEHDKIVRRAIETGRSNWDHTEVLKGLNEGDAVVTSLDQPGLLPGARARAVQKAGAR